MRIERLRAPPLLRAGDRVRVVAPCGPFDRAAFEAGVARLRGWGLEPVFDEGIFARAGYLAGPDERRLAELNAAIADGDARAVWAARGGYGATRILPAVDLAALARRPKWLVGFSDVTALHALWARAGVVSMHAANVTTLDPWQDAAREALHGWLFEGCGPALRGEVVRAGEVVRGPVLGGNVALLAAMVGTGFLPDLTGAILIVEDVREPPYRLDRLLTQLLHARVLDAVAGVAVGGLTRCDDPPEREAACRGIDVVCERLGTLGVPMIVGLPVGHEPDAFPLPLGLHGVLDPARGELRIAAVA
ncbi:MAG: LD-carboxypeptidase [Chromatiales bacterium]|nr:LD-carboxypeptidase [Chromatiales bacterium]